MTEGELASTWMLEEVLRGGKQDKKIMVTSRSFYVFSMSREIALNDTQYQWCDSNTDRKRMRVPKGFLYKENTKWDRSEQCYRA